MFILEVCSNNIALRNLSLLKWLRKLLMFSSYRCPFCSVFFCTRDYSSLTTDISSILNALALVFIDFHQSQLTLLVYTVNSQNLLTPVLVMMLKLLDFKMVILSCRTVYGLQLTLTASGTMEWAWVWVCGAFWVSAWAGMLWARSLSAWRWTINRWSCTMLYLSFATYWENALNRACWAEGEWAQPAGERFFFSLIWDESRVWLNSDQSSPRQKEKWKRVKPVCF